MSGDLNMTVATAFGGICLLVFGRRLFWLFVGILGFIYGLNMAALFLPEQPAWVFIAAALGAGILGSLLAIFLQQVIMGIAGFLSGGYLCFTALTMATVASEQLVWIISAVCGIVCAALFLYLFDWALILVSSLIGALLIVKSVAPGANFQVTASLFAACAIVGVAVQTSLLKRARPVEPPQG